MLNNLKKFNKFNNKFYLPKYIRNSSISLSKILPSKIGINLINFKNNRILGIELKNYATFNI